MQRTYKSKKDVGGGLDHREMLLNMDEKSSAFDAFYIRNIKQTKLEQSCMGSSNNYGAVSKASNKVSKRKYVKRIVKDVDPPPRDSRGHSISGSVFLTPDKSIRVNKAPDLFDQLLNSSPACSDVKQVKKVDPFDQILARTPKDPKTYNRKKKLIKKFNYSSSDDSSVSDKENCSKSENLAQNATDIKAHELIIEKEAEPSPKFDVSIDNIVRKLINNINKKSSLGSVKKTFKYRKNRLTKNLNSPLIKTSPLSSTPFIEKTRSKSIYNFSPIPMGELTQSPNCVTMDEDNEVNKSIVFVPRNISNSLKRSQNEEKLPVAKSDSVCPHINTEHSNPLFSSDADTHDEKLPKHATEIIEDKNLPLNAKNNDLKCIQPSFTATSVMEPFLGLSDQTIAQANDEIHIVEKNDSIIISTGTVSKSSHKSKEISLNNKRLNGNSQEVNEEANIQSSVIEYSVTPEPFFGFTKRTESFINISAEEDTLPTQSFLEFTNVDDDLIQNVDSDRDDLVQNSCVVLYCESPKQSEFQIVECTKNIDSSHDEDSHQTSQKIVSNNDQDGFMADISERGIEIPEEQELNHITPNVNKTVDCDDDTDIISHKDVDSNSLLSSFSSNSEQNNQSTISEVSEGQDCEYDDKQSLYDTCQSGSSQEQENIECVVALERMNIELFQKYHEKDPNKLKMPVVTLERMSMNSLKKYYKGVPEGFSKEPIVVVPKLDSDLFKKYYENMPKYSEEVDSAGEQSAEISDDYTSFEDDDFTDGKDEETEQDTQYTSTASESDSFSTENSSFENKDKNSDEEKYVGFVTTRRRNKFTQDSTILVLDDSQEISECDKTVSNVNIISPNPDVNNTVIGTNDKNILNENDIVKIETNKAESPDTTFSNITIRNSILPRASGADKSMYISKIPDSKPSIILQPGKKWERSLSIYRRMTMDNTILEDENISAKGRKYRQSVFNIMEMQDKSLLHNESINNRRSTFVSKPNRSTIRIVKETNNSRLSLSSTAITDDLKGFIEDCDDTIVELSKLSLVDDHDVTVIENFHEESRIATDRGYVLRRCNQSDTIPFDECYPDPLLKNCRKIGEGVYGEVFLWRAPDGRARVMKVVPIAGTVKVNGEPQKDFHEIISEIVIAMELSALRAPIAEIDCHLDDGNSEDELDLHSVENATDVFNEVLAVRCVYGSYPSRLLDLWELYDETKGSENDNPAILPLDQQFIVLELANAGQDLESYQFTSADQAHALFLQVAYALAVGEEAFQFEHRDLHWGNVLIAPTDQKYATFILRGRLQRVARRGVAATIIDYSLSRLSLPLQQDSAALYNDLATDDSLFAAVGDYQFDVYRLMRDKLGNDWKNFEPYTNILWLHYTLDKMITALRYKKTSTKLHKQFISKLKGLKDRILQYGSAVEFVLTDNQI